MCRRQLIISSAVVIIIGDCLTLINHRPYTHCVGELCSNACVGIMLIGTTFPDSSKFNSRETFMLWYVGVKMGEIRLMLQLYKLLSNLIHS